MCFRLYWLLSKFFNSDKLSTCCWVFPQSYLLTIVPILNWDTCNIVMLRNKTVVFWNKSNNFFWSPHFSGLKIYYPPFLLKIFFPIPPQFHLPPPPSSAIHYECSLKKVYIVAFSLIILHKVRKKRKKTKMSSSTQCKCKLISYFYTWWFLPCINKDDDDEYWCWCWYFCNIFTKLIAIISVV